MSKLNRKEKWIKRLKRIALGVGLIGTIGLAGLSPGISPDNVFAGNIDSDQYMPTGTTDYGGVSLVPNGGTIEVPLNIHKLIKISNSHLTGLSVSSSGSIATQYNLKQMVNGDDADGYGFYFSKSDEQNNPSLSATQLPTMIYSTDQIDLDGKQIDVVISITSATFDSQSNFVDGGIISFRKNLLGVNQSGFSSVSFSYSMVTHGTNNAPNLDSTSATYLELTDIDSSQAVNFGAGTSDNVVMITKDPRTSMDYYGRQIDGVSIGKDTSGRYWFVAGNNMDLDTRPVDSVFAMFKPGNFAFSGTWYKHYDTIELTTGANSGNTYPYTNSVVAAGQQDTITNAVSQGYSGREYLGFGSVANYDLVVGNPVPAPTKTVTDSDETAVQTNSLPTIRAAQTYDVSVSIPDDVWDLDNFILRDTIDPMWNVTGARVVASHAGNPDETGSDLFDVTDSSGTAGNRLFNNATITKNSNGSTSVSASINSSVTNGSMGSGLISFQNRAYHLLIDVTPNPDYALAHMGDNGWIYPHSSNDTVSTTGGNYTSGNNLQIFDQGSIYINYSGAAESGEDSDDNSGNLRTRYTATTRTRIPLINVTVNKTGTVFGNAMPSSFYSVLDAVFQLYRSNSSTTVGNTFATDVGGHATSQRVPMDAYDVKEISTAHGFILNSGWVGKISLTTSSDSNNNISIDMKNDEQFGSFSFQKTDRDKNAVSSAGAGSLDGATYTLRRLYDGKTWTLTTHDGGKFSSSDLGLYDATHFEIADYSLTETKASKGYLVDSTPVNFSVTYAGMNASVAVNATARDSELIIRNDITIHKNADGSTTVVDGQQPIPGYDDDEYNDSIQQRLQGIEFKATLTDGTGYNKTTGTVTSKAGDGNVWYSSLSDVNGNAVFKDLPFGHYTISEEATKQDGSKNIPDGFMAMKPFTVYVSEDKKNGTTDSDGASTRANGYSFDVDDDRLKWPIKVNKVDSQTGKVIPFANTEFNILDLKSGKLLEMNVPNKTDKTTSFKTNEEGYFYTTEPLDYGVDRYQLIEVHTPYGYNLASEPMTVSVDKIDYSDGKDYMEFNFADDPQPGQLDITKVVRTATGIGEQKSDLGTFMGLDYSEVPGVGYDFMLQARDDVITPDGTTRVKKGQYVSVDGTGVDDKSDGLVLTSGEDGKVSTGTILYIGDYTLIETKAPLGVTIADPWDFSVTYGGETVKATYYETTVHDDVQLLNIVGHKAEQVINGYDKDGKPEIAVQDATDGQIFAVRNADDFSLMGATVKADTTLALAQVNGGKFEFDTFLPAGKYYVQEVDSGSKHVLNPNKYFFTYTPKNNDNTQSFQIYANGFKQDKGSETDDDAAPEAETPTDGEVTANEVVTDNDDAVIKQDEITDDSVSDTDILNNLFLTDVPFNKLNQVINDDLYTGSDNYIAGAGAVFELRDSASGKVIQTVTTDKNGNATWKQLGVGEYLMNETKSSDVTHAINTDVYAINVQKGATTISVNSKQVGSIDNTNLYNAYVTEQLPPVEDTDTTVDDEATDDNTAVDTTSTSADTEDSSKEVATVKTVAEAQPTGSAFTVSDPITDLPKPGVDKYIDTVGEHVKTTQDDVDQNVNFVISGQLPLLDNAKNLTDVHLKDNLEEAYTFVKVDKVVDVTDNNKDVISLGKITAPKGKFGGTVDWAANDSSQFNGHILAMHLTVTVNSHVFQHKYLDSKTGDYVVPNVGILHFNGGDLDSNANTTANAHDLVTPPVDVHVRMPGIDKSIVSENNKLVKDKAVQHTDVIQYMVDAYYPFAHNGLFNNVTIYDNVVDALIPQEITKVTLVDDKNNETDVTKQWTQSIEKKVAGTVKVTAKKPTDWAGKHVRMYFTATLSAHATDSKYWNKKKNEYVIPNVGHMTYNNKDADSNANATTKTPGTDLTSAKVNVHLKQPKASVAKFWVDAHGRKKKSLNVRLGDKLTALIIGHVPSVNDLKNVEINDQFEEAFTPTGEVKVEVDGKNVTKEFTAKIEKKAGGFASVKAKDSQKWAGKSIDVYFNVTLNKNYMQKKYRDKDKNGYTIPNVGHLLFNSQSLDSNAKADHNLTSNKIVVHVDGERLANTGFIASGRWLFVLMAIVFTGLAALAGYKAYKIKR
ncbi:isopeptide-forming domain-containing fimbrial protein [Periweissella cryptocerci]|uniref:Isopeptide-forming domain-containing fimbrial protein n=1 Tax=Periweissella cryptocerci TaxID=2506420 RepID=A0A4P6YX49_9LACO|nr:SpaA isopeptide-forming pilin-related protein [Periweissella cryptocerci]QBO37401.1 isopeptide-forming domain-containing fimbrial protein [Periweissella cryptocerci]